MDGDKSGNNKTDGDSVEFTDDYLREHGFDPDTGAVTYDSSFDWLGYDSLGGFKEGSK